MPEPKDVAHLLRRAGFGGTLSQIATLSAQPIATTVDQLLDFTGAPPDTQPAFLGVGEGWEQDIKLLHWWLDRCVNTSKPLQEKLTLFWHGHFATSNHRMQNPLGMYRQNAMFRLRAAGNFRTLAHDVGRDPATLTFLNNDENVAGKTNENFARELMELFILGVGNYTQQDVTEAARAWTGHNTANQGQTYQFYPDRHDNGLKTIMGVTRNWDGHELIDYILRDEPTKKRAGARFIARKLVSFFVYTNPPQSLVDELGDVFYSADLDLKVLLRAMFLHPEFMSVRARYALVRSPAEWAVACLRALHITAEQSEAQWYMEEMGQKLFHPPNVGGWGQNSAWLGATGLWMRATWAKWIAYKAPSLLNDTVGMSPSAAVDRAFEIFSIYAPSPQTRDRLIAWLTAQRSDSSATVQQGLVNLMTIIMLTPEFNVA